MRYNTVLILALFYIGCDYSNQPAATSADLQNDTVKIIEHKDTSHTVPNQDHYVTIPTYFVGEHILTYDDGKLKAKTKKLIHNKTIQIDSQGNISQSKTYKLLKSINADKSIICLLKSTNENAISADTFRFEHQGNNIKLYLINNQLNLYKFTLKNTHK